jgi:hypothetical protein
MKDQIDAILSGVKDKNVNFIAPFWQIRVGTRSGARKNGVSLARELLQQYSEDVAKAAPVTDYDAIIADLKAQLAAKPVFQPHAEPAPVVMPDFLKAPEMPPPELADLIEYADTPVETNEKLLVRLREVLGLIGLAEDAGGRAAPDLYRRKDRLESGIRWNRGRMAETI